MHDDLSPEQGQGGVFRRCLAAATRQAQQLDAAAPKRAHDRIGTIGRRVRHDDDLWSRSGIVQLQQILQSLPDDGLLVMDGQQDAERRPPRG